MCKESIWLVVCIHTYIKDRYIPFGYGIINMLYVNYQYLVYRIYRLHIIHPVRILLWRFFLVSGLYPVYNICIVFPVPRTHPVLYL